MASDLVFRRLPQPPPPPPLAVIVLVLRIRTFVCLSFAVFCFCVFFPRAFASLRRRSLASELRWIALELREIFLVFSLSDFFTLFVFLDLFGFARGLRRCTWSTAPPVAALHRVPPSPSLVLSLSLLCGLRRPPPPAAALPPSMPGLLPRQVMLTAKSRRGRRKKWTYSILPPSIPPSLIFFG